ncbi:uncharacterized protein YALI1_E09155g [Yarrowia lipolytica]|uniref:Uncharacterized protein n=1 Tax=Yarrowia lipolytica TaxID=4952 RepID=A0A1D8NHI2_YARLL|nr:hypothetical protein YALI1_E09155g [Yarrowia lipolytica]
MFVDNVRRIYEALDWRLIFLEAPPQNAQKYGSDMNAVYRLWDSQEVAWFKEEQDGVQMIIHWPPPFLYSYGDPATSSEDSSSNSRSPSSTSVFDTSLSATSASSVPVSSAPSFYDSRVHLTQFHSFQVNIELVDGTSRHHIDDLHLNDITFGRVQTAAHVKQQQNNDWAHVVNVNKGIANFSEVVPQPAREFPFELETFEKEAVCHLDQLD